MTDGKTPSLQAQDALADAVLQPVRGQMAFESCVESLAAGIRLGVFPVGSTLPGERDLAARLEVSRATLREAISALRAAGFVVTTRGRGGGTVVLPSATWPRRDAPDRADLADLLVFRAVVEPGAAYQAARAELDEGRRRLLQSCLDDLAHVDAPEDYRRADARLHLAIAAVCGSEALNAATNTIQIRIHELLAEIPFLRKNIEGSDQQHRTIVQAIIDGDAQRAGDTMRAHCEATAALLNGLLN